MSTTRSSHNGRRLLIPPTRLANVNVAEYHFNLAVMNSHRAVAHELRPVHSPDGSGQVRALSTRYLSNLLSVSSFFAVRAARSPAFASRSISSIVFPSISPGKRRLMEPFLDWEMISWAVGDLGCSPAPPAGVPAASANSTFVTSLPTPKPIVAPPPIATVVTAAPAGRARPPEPAVTRAPVVQPIAHPTAAPSAVEVASIALQRTASTPSFGHNPKGSVYVTPLLPDGGGG